METEFGSSYLGEHMWIIGRYNKVNISNICLWRVLYYFKLTLYILMFSVVAVTNLQCVISYMKFKTTVLVHIKIVDRIRILKCEKRQNNEVTSLFKVILKQMWYNFNLFLSGQCIKEVFVGGSDLFQEENWCLYLRRASIKEWSWCCPSRESSELLQAYYQVFNKHQEITEVPKHS